MPRNERELHRINVFLKDVFSPESRIRQDLIQRAQLECPGEAYKAHARQHGKSPTEAMLTNAQRKVLKKIVSREHWKQLSGEQREQYMSGQNVIGNPFMQSTCNEAPSVQGAEPASGSSGPAAGSPLVLGLTKCHDSMLQL